jgi:hypothetical protein
VLRLPVKSRFFLKPTGFRVFRIRGRLVNFLGIKTQNKNWPMLSKRAKFIMVGW